MCILKKTVLYSLTLILLSLPYSFTAHGFETLSLLNRAFQVGAAFMTNLAIHETGHAAAASYVGAEGIKLNFLTKHDGQFFLGRANVDRIDYRSRLPYSMGGEIATSLTFEYALGRYRKEPTVYNRSLLLFSSTDFLWYSIYSFYLTDGNPDFDPIAVRNETGFSKESIFSIALAQSLLNAYRIYSGYDRIVPYFTFDKYSVSFNVRVNFN